MSDETYQTIRSYFLDAEEQELFGNLADAKYLIWLGQQEFAKLGYDDQNEYYTRALQEPVRFTKETA